MHAITGITGQVGSQVAKELLSSGHQIRAVLRDERKARAWRELGCEIALAEMNDAAALTRAFTGAEAVFVLLPANFDPSPGFTETKGIVEALFMALSAARPGRVVALSTIGAQATQENLLSQLQIMERRFEDLSLPVAFLRPAWFMENAAWDIAGAKELGVLPAFLQPVDKPVPMVATRDVAAAAAQMLEQEWSGRKVLELEGPHRVTPSEIALTLSSLLRRDVQTQPVPRSTWETLFRSQGMKNPGPRIRMLDGFNEGWLEFASKPEHIRKGPTSISTVLRSLVEPSGC